MATDLNFRQDQGYPGDQMNGAYYNARVPYDDPAIVNPNELATFPKQVKLTDGHHHHEAHHASHRTPVRDGRNIIRTDNHPDKNGYM